MDALITIEAAEAYKINTVPSDLLTVKPVGFDSSCVGIKLYEFLNKEHKSTDNTQPLLPESAYKVEFRTFRATREALRLTLMDYRSTFDNITKDVMGLLDSCIALHGGTCNHTYVRNQGWMDRFRDALKEVDAEILGTGYFAMGIRFNKLSSCSVMFGNVLKIGVKKEDSGAAYAAYCRHTAGAKHLSNIKHIARYEAGYTVIMPEYLPYNEYSNNVSGDNQDVELMRLSFRYARQLIQFGFNHCNLEALAVDHIRSIFKIDHTEFKTAGIDSHINYLCNVQSLLLENKDYLTNLESECKAIQEYFRNISRFDLHDENVMIELVDGKPRLIITDPVSYSEGHDDYPF